MKQMLYLDAAEIEQYRNEIQRLRNETETSRKKIFELTKEIEFLKDSGEDILVIVKDVNKHTSHEFKSTEKELLNNLVLENKSIRDKYDELSREKDNIDNQKQMIIMKYQEMDNFYKNQIKDMNNYLDYLEKRSFLDRVKNTLKPRDNEKIISYGEDLFLENNHIQTIYTESELKKLEAEVKSIKKPRGWHFKETFEDSEGNIYHKGKLQPHLKK